PVRRTALRPWSCSCRRLCAQDSPSAITCIRSFGPPETRVVCRFEFAVVEGEERRPWLLRRLGSPQLFCVAANEAKGHYRTHALQRTAADQATKVGSGSV